MDEGRWTTEQFEEHRSHLRGVAYRMLGSLAEADDAVQETWLRLQRADTDDVENLGGWLTTVISRVCLNMLRSRGNRREDAMGVHVPDPIVRSLDAATGPEADALLADSVGLALLVVLETLSPAERVAFVLHDVFAMPFDEVAEMVDRTPAAARQLASRARRRVQNVSAEPDADLAQQQVVVDAFFAAARAGDLAGLIAVLDPDVVTRADAGPGRSRIARGPEAVAQSAMTYANPAAVLHPVAVNGGAGVIITLRDRPVAVMGFTIRGGKVVAIDALNDPARLRLLDLPAVS
jgi:RNA polymerase sigma-70 factor (ECF subfamily)